MVSVIIPTYNGERFLERMVASLGDQKYLELIFVDDGSTDRTREVAAQYGRVYNTPKHSGGPDLGRTLGIQKATGRFLCFHDQDDVSNSDRWDNQLVVEAPITYGGYDIFNATLGRVRTVCETDRRRTHPCNSTFRAVLGHAPRGRPYLGSLLIRRDVCPEIFSGERRFLLDLLEGRSVVEVPEVLMTRMVHGENLSLTPTFRAADLKDAEAVARKYKYRYPKEAKQGPRRSYASAARFAYVAGDLEQARRWFLRGNWTPKTVGYFLSTYVGHGLVRRHFPVTGSV